MKESDLSRLLGRDPIFPDMSEVYAALSGRRILVSGAAGSIGAELSRQLSRIEGVSLCLADLSVSHGVERFVMISTDKAVNPTNIMGATKRACELYVQSHTGATRFVTTRFGNVLGSNGSVVPLFMEQLAAGGPLTVTHREVVRYFMLISEACALVLLAAVLGRGGEIFVFDMGRPVRIADLARRIITLWGKGYERISYTGLRPGEKLYEEVLTSDELTLPGPHPMLKIARVRPANFNEVAPAVDSMLRQAAEGDVEQAIKSLKRLVPEFKSKNSPFEKYDAD